MNIIVLKNIYKMNNFTIEFYASSYSIFEKGNFIFIFHKSFLTSIFSKFCSNSWVFAILSASRDSLTFSSTSFYFFNSSSSFCFFFISLSSFFYYCLYFFSYFFISYSNSNSLGVLSI